MGAPRLRSEMDIKQQCDALLGILHQTDMFEVTAMQRRKRLQTFFGMLATLQAELQEDGNEALVERVRQKWAHFHRKLCDAEASGEYLACFLNGTLHFTNAFGTSAVTVYKTVAESPRCTALDMFKLLAQGGNQSELIRALKDNCHKVPTKITYKYLHVRVLPAIFTAQTTDEEREELCDLVLSLPMGFALQFMHKDTQTKYKQDVVQKYIKFVYNNTEGSVFRSDWCMMCKTLLHYSGKMLHCDTYLQNAILKVIEEAFKNASVELRCAAFDCWQVLIDNYALERKYIAHVKQTSLLLKPLRARISRNRAVASKKYDVYVHMLRRMRFPAPAVEKFLADAFGPFTEDVPDSLRLDSVQHFKDLSSSYPQSTEVLLKALGHRRASCACAGKATWVADTCGGEEPPVDGEVAYEVLIQSARLCSQLNANSLINARPEICEVLTKCVWSSMFKHFQQEKYLNSKKEICTAIEVAILKILRCSAMNIAYFNTFFKHVLACLVDFLNAIGFYHDLYTTLVLPTITNLITYSEELPSNMFADSVRPLCTFCEAQPHFVKTLAEVVKVCKTQLHADVLAYCISRYARLFEKETYSSRYDEALSALIRRFVEANCNSKITPTFDRVYVHLIKAKSLDLMKIYVGLMVGEEALRPGLLKILAVTLSYVVNHSMVTSEIYGNLLEVIIDCLHDFKVENSTEVLLNIAMAVNMFKPSFERIATARRDYPELKIEEVKLLIIHYQLLKLKMYSVLETLSALIDFVDIVHLPKGLYELVTALTDCNEEEVAKKAFNVFGKIHLKNGVSPKNGKHAPKVMITSQIVIPATTPTQHVRIFGGYLDSSPSPKSKRIGIVSRVRTPTSASTSKNTTPVKPKPVNLDDFSQSAFVSVDKEVVVDVAKMTEHQREAVGKKCNIPAMYEDLSQSNSMPLVAGEVKDEKCKVIDGKGKVGVEKSKVKEEKSKVTDDKSKVKENKLAVKENKMTLEKNKMVLVKTLVVTRNKSVVTRTKMEEVTAKSEVKEELTLPTKLSDKIEEKRGRKRKDLPTTSSPQIEQDTTKRACASESPKQPKTEDSEVLDTSATEEMKTPGGLKSRAGTRGRTEFQKLKMDIVDGDKFFNLSRTRRRKSAAYFGALDYLTEITSDDSDSKTSVSKKDRRRSEPSTDGKKKIKSRNLDENVAKIVQNEKKDDESTIENTTHMNMEDKEEDTPTDTNDEQNIVSKVVEEETPKIVEEEKTDVQDVKEDSLEKKKNVEVKTVQKEVVEQKDVQKEQQEDEQEKKVEEKPPKPTEIKEHEDVTGLVMKDTDSENIIPSSQECTVNLFRLPLYSPTKYELEEARTRHKKTAVQFASEAIIAKIDFASLEQHDQSEVTTQNGGDKTSAVSANDETFTLDVVANTSADVDVAQLDTESFISNTSMHLPAGDVDDEAHASPSPKNKMSLASALGTSPVTTDTPTRTRELLDNTLAISPIKIVAVGGAAVGGRASPDLFGSEGVTAAAAASSSEDGVEAEVQMYFKPDEGTAAALKNPSSRSAKLLHLIGQSGAGAATGTGVVGRMMSPARAAVVVQESVRVAGAMSPTTNRIRKMMLNCGDSATPGGGGGDELPKMLPGDILGFERVLPSPLALPKGSILKRKIPDTVDDGLSPCAKRKRVNFSDPPTTCEKMYFKEIEEKDKPIALRKKKRFVTRLLTATDADEPTDENDADENPPPATTAAENASDAIQNMQQQIDGLAGMEGVSPLVDTSPSKEDRLSPLPTNAPPELLAAGAISTAYDDLFPSDSQPAASKHTPPKNPPGRSLECTLNFVLSNAIEMVRNGSGSVTSYLKYALKDITTEEGSLHFRSEAETMQAYLQSALKDVPKEEIRLYLKNVEDEDKEAET